MLKRISDDNLCSDKDLEAIEEMYNKLLESNNKEINLDEQTIKLMHGKITKERIENFKNINIIINNKYLTLEENNHVTSLRKKYNLIKWITIIGITLLIIIFSVIVVIVNFNR